MLAGLCNACSPSRSGACRCCFCRVGVTATLGAFSDALVEVGTGTTSPQKFTSYTFDITYSGPVVGGSSDSGTVVTNKTTDVHAGWPIQLGAELAPSDLATQFTWSIEGAGGNGSAAINGYCSNAATGAAVLAGATNNEGVVVPLDPGSDAQSTFPDPASPGIFKYYYYTKSGDETASVVPQGAGASPARTTFAVAEYTENMVNSYQSGVVSTPIPSGIELSLGPPGAFNQITFKQQLGNNDNGFAGTLHFIQVYTEDDHWIGDTAKNIPNFSAVDSGLDEYYYYPREGLAPVYTGDAPSILSDDNYVKMTVDDTPTMWAVYQPAAPGSIIVPMALQGWQWGGTETLNTSTGQWTLTNAVPLGPGPLSPLDPTDEYPEWSHILEPPKPPN